MGDMDPSLMQQYSFETQSIPILIPTVEDPKRIRNRLAQRKFRSKSKKRPAASKERDRTPSAGGTEPYGASNVQYGNGHVSSLEESNLSENWTQPYHPAAQDSGGQGEHESQIGAYSSDKGFDSSFMLVSDTQRWPPVRHLTLEQRIRHVIDAKEEVGFESIDAAVTLYYTAKFPENSLLRYAQSASRSHRLGKFLTSLHESSDHWVGREARGYHDGQMSCIERTCLSELGGLQQRDPPLGITQNSNKRAFITDIIGRLVAEEITDTLLRSDGHYLKEKVKLALSR
ncbi:hypothetical protein MGYG_03436 [Nannizzia gypsea CBS 118893]|uniref:BZIP domain-containing protein n=1 Tax=Arthroderma gypseum (strain ATCC MYA-4604 / CBS 118893) TaxID=535722 RepID=E4URW2_ARTGP|nr:hypothetical protein MGYG_03436 [Nannizzia gypsea CBS 118893]EFR00433.1 hypothetical protein MGYG_03436 [Nannizzia gypsea CBS 118893]